MSKRNEFEPLFVQVEDAIKHNGKFASVDHFPPTFSVDRSRWKVTVVVKRVTRLFTERKSL